MKVVLPITHAEMQVLVALYLVEPATTGLVDVTTTGDSRPRLRRLVRKGLAVRTKIERADEDRDDPTYRGRDGRKPYSHSLTPRGRTISAHLFAVYSLMTEEPCTRTCAVLSKLETTSEAS